MKRSTSLFFLVFVQVSLSGGCPGESQSNADKCVKMQVGGGLAGEKRWEACKRCVRDAEEAAPDWATCKSRFTSLCSSVANCAACSGCLEQVYRFTEDCHAPLCNVVRGCPQAVILSAPNEVCGSEIERLGSCTQSLDQSKAEDCTSCTESLRLPNAASECDTALSCAEIEQCTACQPCLVEIKSLHVCLAKRTCPDFECDTADSVTPTVSPTTGSTNNPTPLPTYFPSSQPVVSFTSEPTGNPTPNPIPLPTVYPVDGTPKPTQSLASSRPTSDTPESVPVNDLVSNVPAGESENESKKSATTVVAVVGGVVGLAVIVFMLFRRFGGRDSCRRVSNEDGNNSIAADPVKAIASDETSDEESIHIEAAVSANDETSDEESIYIEAVISTNEGVDQRMRDEPIEEEGTDKHETYQQEIRPSFESLWKSEYCD